MASLTVSNVTAKKQQIGLATKGVWRGDDLSSGILGLGLPGLTDSFSGETAAATRDNLLGSVAYSPLVTTMATQVSPIFSLALSRDKTQSWLAWGGIPNTIKTVGEWATTPLKKVFNDAQHPSHPRSGLLHGVLTKHTTRWS